MMPSSPKEEIKLMMLYMLKKVSFSLNHENLGNFFIDKYTSYIQFQQIIAELEEAKFIEEYKTKTSVFYKLTKDGEDALDSFVDDISDDIKAEIDKFIKDNKIKLKEESIITSNYSDNNSGSYRINLEINENKDENFKLIIDVPTADAAITMCENWKEKAKAIYAYVMKQLL